MSQVTIWHNPKCSKSRQTLQLLRDQGVEPEVYEYLKANPGEAEIKELLGQLGISARQLLRTKEAEYKELDLKNPAKSEEDLIQAMAQHPRLIERPIYLREGRAALGRPPEQVLELLP